MGLSGARDFLGVLLTCCPLLEANLASRWGGRQPKESFEAILTVQKLDV